MSDNSGDENYWAKEAQFLEEKTHEEIVAGKDIKAGWNKFLEEKAKPFRTHLIELSETARSDLEIIYKDYLTNKIDLETAQKKVLLIEHDFELLLRGYIEPEPDTIFQIQGKQFIDAIIDGTREKIDFHKRKLHIDESAGYKVIAVESNNGSDAIVAEQATPSIVKTEEIPTEIPAVIVDLIKKSGMVEAERDLKGRFHLIGTYKDTDTIGWIVEYSKYEKNLSAVIYSQYIYTKCQQSTLEKYISNARNS
jgi:hypothetical protein